MTNQELAAFQELWLASNELRTHIELQPPSSPLEPGSLQYALDRLFTALSNSRPFLESSEPYLGLMKEDNA